METVNETWYLLYDGDSVDGMGHAKYAGRTCIFVDALSHYLKCKNNPYSTGYVEIVTDYKLERMFLAK